MSRGSPGRRNTASSSNSMSSKSKARRESSVITARSSSRRWLGLGLGGLGAGGRGREDDAIVRTGRYDIAHLFMKEIGVFLPPPRRLPRQVGDPRSLPPLRHFNPSRYLSASSAAMQPVPALVTAWR